MSSGALNLSLENRECLHVTDRLGVCEGDLKIGKSLEGDETKTLFCHACFLLSMCEAP